jgi:hypothetical protein
MAHRLDNISPPAAPTEDSAPHLSAEARHDLQAAAAAQRADRVWTAATDAADAAAAAAATLTEAETAAAAAAAAAAADPTDPALAELAQLAAARLTQRAEQSASASATAAQLAELAATATADVAAAAWSPVAAIAHVRQLGGQVPPDDPWWERMRERITPDAPGLTVAELVQYVAPAEPITMSGPGPHHVAPHRAPTLVEADASAGPVDIYLPDASQTQAIVRVVVINGRPRDGRHAVIHDPGGAARTIYRAATAHPDELNRWQIKAAHAFRQKTLAAARIDEMQAAETAASTARLRALWTKLQAANPDAAAAADAHRPA